MPLSQSSPLPNGVTPQAITLQGDTQLNSTTQQMYCCSQTTAAEVLDDTKLFWCVLLYRAIGYCVEVSPYLVLHQTAPRPYCKPGLACLDSVSLLSVSSTIQQQPFRKLDLDASMLIQATDYLISKAEAQNNFPDNKYDQTRLGHHSFDIISDNIKLLPQNNCSQACYYEMMAFSVSLMKTWTFFLQV